MTIDDLRTPCLLVEESVLRRNIDELAAAIGPLGCAVRPHVKTHKCPRIARMQLEAGAVGLTVATAWEAVVFSSVSDDIFVARSQADPHALRLIVRLATLGKRMIVGVDCAEGVRLLADAAAAAGLRVEVRIEVDTGQERCGVSPEGALRLARAVAGESSLELEGIFSHEGHIYTSEAPDPVRAVASECAGIMAEAAALLRGDGHAVPTVSVGATPTRTETPRHGGITEVRPGTYALNDYTQVLLGTASFADCAATVLSTVVSVHEDGRVVVDAGHKALAADGAKKSAYGVVAGTPPIVCGRASEEHGILAWPGALPVVGSRVRIVPYHVCPAVNLHRELALVDGSSVVEIATIAASGYGPLVGECPCDSA